LDHINLEKTEIKNIMNKFAQQTVENTLAVASSNDTQENPINIQDENNENLENSQQQQMSQELSDSINHNQESQEREKGQAELEESTPEISNTDENDHKEINPIITSTN
jgi:recombinational DNA repair protein RecT